MKTSLTVKNFVTCLLAHLGGCVLAIYLPVNGFGDDELIILLLAVLGSWYVPFRATKKAKKIWEKKSAPFWRYLAVLVASLVYAGEGWYSVIHLNTLMGNYVATEEAALLPQIGSKLFFFIIFHSALLSLLWLWGRWNEASTARSKA